jgi:hypothetical protein
VNNDKEKTVVPILAKTVGLTFTPLEGTSDTAVAAVTGISSGAGHGVRGTSKNADGVHGESSAPTFSAVAGQHSAGGHGVYGSSSGNAGWFDGAVTITGGLTVLGDITLPGGADCAERFDTAGDAEIEPGTLVVLDDDGYLKASDSPYDHKVAGIVAGANAYRPAIILDKNKTVALRTAVSLIGKAYCKVDADHGAIAIGDLLVSSPTPGCAMKAADRGKSFGAVVGKALKPLASGRGLIPVLIALQ